MDPPRQRAFKKLLMWVIALIVIGLVITFAAPLVFAVLMFMAALIFGQHVT